MNKDTQIPPGLVIAFSVLIPCILYLYSALGLWGVALPFLVALFFFISNIKLLFNIIRL